MPSLSIRNATEADIPDLKHIELAAATMLQDIAPPNVLDESTDPEDFREAIREGLLWVAAESDRVVGFLLVELLEGDHPHLEEVDVHPHFQHQGIGTQLVLTALAWLEESPYSTMTLTTFRAVPWNMPFYKGLGFTELQKSEYCAVITEIIEDEAQRGMSPDERVVMVFRTSAQPDNTGPSN